MASTFYQKLLSFLSLQTPYKKLFSDLSAKILVLGLDGVGKTTFLRTLAQNKNLGGEVVTTIPKPGHAVEKLTHVHTTLICLEVGGCSKYHANRYFEKEYYLGTDGIIFIIDSTDRDRIVEVREELRKALRGPEIGKNVPVLVFLIKEDLPGAICSEELIGPRMLDLGDLKRPWHVQSVGNWDGNATYEGLNCLVETVRQSTKEDLGEKPQEMAQVVPA